MGYKYQKGMFLNICVGSGQEQKKKPFEKVSQVGLPPNLKLIANREIRQNDWEILEDIETL